MRETIRAILVSLAVSAPAAAQELKEDTLGRLKAATVFITVEGVQSEAWGSGFLFLKRGTTGYILTCEHVVSGAQAVKVVLNSGQAGERTIVGKVIATDAERDLACVILKDVKDLPANLELGTITAVRETESVFAAGFPFGKMLAAGKKNPEISVSRAAVSSIRRNAAGQVVAVQMSGDINPGNSGGPLIDSKGKVVGVTQSKVGGTETAFAVPGEEITGFLKGSVKAGYARHASGSPTASKYVIAVEVADPLSKLKSVSVAYCPKSAVKDAKPAADGTWSKAHATMKVVGLKLSDDVGTVEIELTRAAGEPDTVEYAFQITYTFQDGKTVWMEPAIIGVKFGAPAARPDPGPTNPPPGPAPAPPAAPELPPEKGGPIVLSDELPMLAKWSRRTVLSDMFLSKDGSTLFALDVTECKLYKLGADKLQVLAELTVPENAFGMCVSPDGKNIVVATRDPVWPRTVNERAVSTWTCIATASFAVTATFKLDLAPWDFDMTDNGLVVVSTVASGDRLLLVDVNKKALVGPVAGHFNTAFVHLHPDQSRAYLGDAHTSPPDFRCVGLRREKDRSTGQEGYPFYDSKYHGEHPLGGDFAISSDGRYMVSTHGGVVKLAWGRDKDLQSVGKVERASSIAFSRGTVTMLLSTSDGTLLAYELPALEPKKSVKLGARLTSMVFDGPRKRLYAVSSAVQADRRSYAEDPFVAGDLVVYSLSGK